MTREEARKAAEVMLAYADGKEIEYRNGALDWEGILYPNFYWRCNNYRVKPDPKIRPFHDVEECWKEMWKHDPFGWIRWKEAPHNYQTLSIVANTGVDCVTDDVPMSFQEALDTMVFADGEPFGILEEEEEQ